MSEWAGGLGGADHVHVDGETPLVRGARRGDSAHSNETQRPAWPKHRGTEVWAARRGAPYLCLLLDGQSLRSPAIALTHVCLALSQGGGLMPPPCMQHTHTSMNVHAQPTLARLRRRRLQSRIPCPSHTHHCSHPVHARARSLHPVWRRQRRLQRDSAAPRTVSDPHGLHMGA